MLAVSHLGNNHDDHQYHIIHQQRQEEEEEEKTMMMMERVADSAGGGGGLPHDLRDFCNSNSSSLLLDSIDFEDLFLGIHEGDVLPDLEMDPELLADFSLTSNNDESSDTLINTSTVDNKSCTGDGTSSDYSSRKKKEGGGDNNFDQSSCRRRTGAEEVVSKMSKVAANVVVVGKAGKKTTTTGQPSKNNAQVKRKVKVDWTAELHRRFVQAVEQLGVDKAVPSRILELMGIHCLTRHNIASHLQKYRSHRKHLLAREAEAACWSQRRQIYGAVPVVAPAAAAATVGGGNNKSMSRSDVISPCWVPPATLGLFPPPPVTAAAPVPPIPHFRPLHVWGHPTITDQSQANIWQKHHPPPHPPSTHPPAAASAWPPPLHHHFQPQTPPPYWPHQHQPVPNVAGAGGTPCFTPPPLILPPPTAVPGIPPPPHHGMYKLVKAASSLIGPRPLDLLPSKESIDAAIGDVLWKPWLPMPLGLKPPSVDGVMGELHRQGLPNIPLNPTTFPLPSPLYN